MSEMGSLFLGKYISIQQNSSKCTHLPATYLVREISSPVFDILDEIYCKFICFMWYRVVKKYSYEIVVTRVSKGNKHQHMGYRNRLKNYANNRISLETTTRDYQKRRLQEEITPRNSQYGLPQETQLPYHSETVVRLNWTLHLPQKELRSSKPKHYIAQKMMVQREIG